ncbi:hypothetical protein [Bradyrhizobium sp. LMG 9283]|uniref:hypothetical protein n=1 Tax=Bradyrhizobium sp. LMG 9283 TaxID=592064 RepID=UPI00388CFF94
MTLAIQREWLPEAACGHVVDILPMLRNHLRPSQPHLNPDGSLQMMKLCRLFAP